MTTFKVLKLNFVNPVRGILDIIVYRHDAVLYILWYLLAARIGFT
jgi:hypothetical protein